MSFSRLFSEGSIGSLRLSSRVLLPAMATAMAEPDYTIGERLIAYHALRAKNGCAMNITEFTAVHPSTHFPRTPALYEDGFIAGLQNLAKAIHAQGGRLCVQLWHAGRQASTVSTGGQELLAPSAIALGPGWETPREMTAEQIQEMVECFGDAALRAKRAGADAVEVHGAHGYLINQFFSAWSNRRTDDYGGSLENRARFALEILQNIRKKVGPGYPVLFRITAEERIPCPEAVRPKQAVELAKLAEEAGCDAIHVSIGGYCAMWDMIPSIEHEPGFNVCNAKRVKEAVQIPVIAVGRINDPALAENILAEGYADFISMGRAQLADPEFVKKAREGRAEEIVKCIACNQGCIGRYGQSPHGAHLTCLRNPACGHEFLKKYSMQKAENAKKVLIAGGGIAGLEAGRLLHMRGHQVTVCEKDKRCGGQFLLAGVPPHKQEISAATLQMEQAARRAGVDIRLGTEVTEELLGAIRPDVLVIATGADPITPDISGVEQVVTALDVLRGAQLGKKVAVLGGGLVGVETAEYLSAQGKDVVLIEMQNQLAPKADTYKKHALEMYLRTYAPEVLLETRCTSIQEGEITLLPKNGASITRKMDSVVLAVGMRAQNSLQAIAQGYGIPAIVIGDAKEPRLAIDAIWEAHDCAISI